MLKFLAFFHIKTAKIAQKNTQNIKFNKNRKFYKNIR